MAATPPLGIFYFPGEVVILAASKYKTDYTPQLIKWMTRCGLTDKEIAAELGVTARTIYHWKQKHPEVAEAMAEPKNFIDSLVEDALLKRALGYEYTETKKRMNSEGETTYEEVTTKAVVPEVAAQIFWLKNRLRDRWKDRVPDSDDGDDGTGALREFLTAMRQAAGRES